MTEMKIIGVKWEHKSQISKSLNDEDANFQTVKSTQILTDLLYKKVSQPYVFTPFIFILLFIFSLTFSK